MFDLSSPLGTLGLETRLLKAGTCPNCWHSFPPHDACWISVHSSLQGDPQLGPEEQLRFPPTRFDVEGRAFDPMGSPCHQLACPRCHLLVPRATFELENSVFSILGAPGSGKSVFLASMTFSIRQEAARFGLRFEDADLVLNRRLIEDERKLFLEQRDDEYQPIDQVIEKTQLAAVWYNKTIIDGQEVRYVPPFTFIVQPTSEHPKYAEQQRLRRMLCIYDNAGEHFEPGQDQAAQPVTRHLALSKGLIFIFDCTQDPRIRKALRSKATAIKRAFRQDHLLLEAGNRIKTHAGLSQAAKIRQPLMVVLTKYDAWGSLLPELTPDQLKPWRSSTSTKVRALSLEKMEKNSRICREFLIRNCPELVTAAEGLFESVTFAPVMAVGSDVVADARTGLPSIRFETLQPVGVLTPLLALLRNNPPNLVPTIRA